MKNIEKAARAAGLIQGPVDTDRARAMLAALSLFLIEMDAAATGAQAEALPALYGNRYPNGSVHHAMRTPEAVRNEAEAWGQPVHELVALYIGPAPESAP